MKKVLLGTTALVAAGAFAGIGAAQAQDVMLPMKAGVGGYYNFALVSTDTDGDNTNRGHGFQQNIEMEFQGETALDNGMTAGVRIRLSGNNPGPNNIDETEVYFKGAFGGLHLGMVESAGYQTQSWAPGGGPVGSVKSSWFGGGGAWGDVGYMEEDAPKIVYFSPTLNGISLGVSYAPEDTNHSYASMSDSDGDDKQGEQVTAAIGYSSDLMGGSFSAMVGHEGHSTESNEDGTACMGDGCDPSGLRYGVSVSIDDIAVGIAIYEQDGTGTGGMDRKMTDAGIAWTQGPLMLGLQYGSNDGGGGSEADSTSLNLNYNLGGGVDLGAVYATGDRYDSVAGMQRGYTEILLGTMFNF
jgi:predicted porin